MAGVLFILLLSEPNFPPCVQARIMQNWKKILMQFLTKHYKEDNRFKKNVDYIEKYI
jgi:hypothetical protein